MIAEYRCGVVIGALMWSFPAGGMAEQAAGPIDLDFSLGIYADRNTQGGTSEDTFFSYAAKIRAKLDGESAGWWDGFSAEAVVQYSDGDDILDTDPGVLLITPNIESGFPRNTGDEFDLSFTVSQRVSDKVALTFGKLNVVDLATKAPLVGGNDRGSFLYTGIAVPITFVTPPTVLMGRISVSTSPVSYSLMIYDARNAQNDDIWDNPFGEGVVFNGTATYATKLNGKPGFYSLNLIHSTEDGTDYDSLLLPPDDPGFNRTISGLSFAAAKVQQYLNYDQTTGKGWGVFGQLGFGDGNPHPLDAQLVFGLTGDSPIKNRQDDRWGLAYSRYYWSNDLRATLEANGSGINDEWAIEAFYEAEITKNFRVGVNAMKIRPGTFGSDDYYQLGLRARVLY